MRLFAFPAFLAILWLALYAAWRELPYIRPGAIIVYTAKETSERDGTLFPSTVPPSRQLIVFGNSKVLTGFMPTVFDAQINGIFSANMGKPDESHFVKDLELLARAHQLPHRILLTLPWSSTPPPSLFPDDITVSSTLFPFRKLPRDLILFSALALHHGGWSSFYRYGENTVRKMNGDRGWYFIEGQSHYPGSRLPDDFHLGTDTPGIVDDPAFAPRGEEFRQLNSLAEQHHLQFYLVPSYHRTGELAPSPVSAATVARRMRDYPRFTVPGPNYFLFPPRYFSDPVHLNPEGARLYTQQLARVMEPALR